MDENKQYELEDLRFAKALIKHGYVSANPESLAKVIAATKNNKTNANTPVDIVDVLLKMQ